ncbi:MAG: pyridoxal phosphate-dependent aminotransferase [Lentisphaerae bacterium]|nr:pyridoxal phosphate-dependent aminotransferase [Lentisphaerota bacterium]
MKTDDIMKIAGRVECVQPSPPRAVFDLASTLDDVVDLTLGDPDLPPPENVRAAACRAIMEGKTRYSANAGLKELRKAIALDAEKNLGFPVDPDREIIVTVGAMEASFLSLYTLLEPGDEVVIHAPYWINYSQVVRSLGATPVFVYTRPEENFQLTAEALEAVLTPRTRLVILNSPNNPTGAIIPRETLKKIASLAQERNFAVLSDEIYDSLIYDGKSSTSILSFPGMRERSILINGMSKRFAMTGYRLGWAIGPAPLIAQMTKMQENIVACAPLPAQYAGIEALSSRTDSSFIRQEFQRRRDVLFNGINAIPGLVCKPIPSTFYAMVDICGSGLEAEDFVYRMLKEVKVATVFGPAYGGEFYKNFIRIAFTMKEERLKTALERIADFMDRLKK